MPGVGGRGLGLEAVRVDLLPGCSPGADGADPEGATGLGGGSRVPAPNPDADGLGLPKVRGGGAL